MVLRYEKDIFWTHFDIGVFTGPKRSFGLRPQDDLCAFPCGGFGGESGDRGGESSGGDG